jgi:hypothetical protein
MEIILLLLLTVLIIALIFGHNGVSKFETYKIVSEGNFYRQRPTIDVYIDKSENIPGFPPVDFSRTHFNKMFVPDAKLLVGAEEVDESIVYEDQLPQIHRNYNPTTVPSRIIPDGDDIMDLYTARSTSIVPH